MKNEIISVIVPVYNQEKYLERCVNSIINQTYTSLEIILVNDGSKDNSGMICDRYAKIDSRIKVIHIDNIGLSGARNKGLESANGDYIAFVDSDDYIEMTMYEKMLIALRSNDVKMVCCGRYDVDKEDNKKKGKCPAVCNILSTEEALSCVLKGQECDSAVWDKLYTRSLWDNVRFPEGKYYEDIAVIYQIIENAKRMYTLNVPFYNYVHHGNGITASRNMKYCVDYCENTKSLLDYILSKHPDVKEEALCSRIGALATFLRVYDLQQAEDKSIYLQDALRYRKEFRSYFRVWGRSEQYSLKQKIVYVLLSLNLYRIYKKV